ncbi:hypothetical protein AB6F54_20050 [Providencia huaxiensis]|uniref:Uncharacterized protein n=1 Tax=Providencia huashanensis TaxID=3037798 RepID=A0ABT9AVN3_9GAMM|nr:MULTISPECIES: hypothetical protein [Morganellaceae]EKT9734968.1 hypothetical protein [Proteus mirabilis]EKW6744344.1 hypothetical protein [Proteus mirabilis]EKX9076936.1 hypothetical protein [Proteus mirabilis]MBN4867378.1 hypothetical protein [Providencia stuartii]MBN4876829.1 hypothetical protein [Providencia stuartii]
MSEQVYGDTLKFFADWQKNEKKRSCLNFQKVVSRSGVPTLNIEIAPLEKDGTARWEQKLTIQLSLKELTQLSALVLLSKKYIDNLDARYHGDHRNKGLSVFDNGKSGMIFMISEAGQMQEHGIDQYQRLELTVFIVQQLSAALKISYACTVVTLKSLYLIDTH